MQWPHGEWSAWREVSADGFWIVDRERGRSHGRRPNEGEHDVGSARAVLRGSAGFVARGTRAASAAYGSGVATEWFALALQIVQQTPGFSPRRVARARLYLGIALYESVVPGVPQQPSLAGQLNELNSLPLAQPDGALHWPTVANASLAAMTRMMFPTASAENKARIDLLERSLPLKARRGLQSGARFDQRPRSAPRPSAG